MNNSFAKNALAAGVVAAMSYAQPSLALSLAPVASDVVVLGCTVPGAGTTVSTIYSVDNVSSQNSTYSISLPTAVAVGQSCAAAIAAMGAQSTAAITTGGTTLVAGYFSLNTANANGAPVSQAIPTTGYSLQQFTFQGNGSTANTNAYVGYIGCTAPNAAGGTVYSVDTTNQTNSSSVTTLNALVGKPCGYALSKAAQAAGTGFGGVSSSTAQTAQGEVVLNINSSGYSLNQYTFQ